MKKNKGNKNVLSRLSKAVKKKSPAIHPNSISKFVADVVEDKSNKKNLKSNLEAKNLEEYLDLAKLSHKNYEVLNEQIVLQQLSTNTNKEIGQNQFSKVFLGNVIKNSEIKTYETKPLSIPKRPRWNEGISVTEFERMEREAFLNWRRALASEEEKNMNYSITPFEKNIEVWRQLWMVVEKCQILIQIVDGRNPLYFRCPDLEEYIKSVDENKAYFLLVNKADLMSKNVRNLWAKYFKEKGINFAFFSALEEEKKFEEMKNLNTKEDNEISIDDEELDEQKNLFENLIVPKENEKEELEEEINKVEKNKIEFDPQDDKKEIKINMTNDIIVATTDEVQEKVNMNLELNNAKDVELFDESIRIFNREELINLLHKMTQSKVKDKMNKCYYVGFIGYPNVGKSSVINVLMKTKRVGVALMPGKTKHYQTLFLPDNNEICLMDCPGLVFPSFTSSKADMVVNGILPIDTIKEYHNPIAIIIQKIPRLILETFYKIELPDIYSATQFLQILASKRGFITGRSLPDEAKTSKMVLKDYVSGKLLYCHIRPDYDENLHGKIILFQEDIFNKFSEEEFNNEEEKEKMHLIQEIPADFDDDYDKLNIDVDLNRNLTTQKDNFDKLYFENEFKNEDELNSNKTKKISKDMKRALKFAVKRGEITEEEYEDALTVADYEILLFKIQKSNDKNKKDLVGVKKIAI